MDSGDFSFSANGKLLLTAEYFVLEGATALAVPSKFGQHLSVVQVRDGRKVLEWESVNAAGVVWLKVAFGLPDLEILGVCDPVKERLQLLLKTARQQNPLFLQNKSISYQVSCRLDFPNNWGLGSSSTLVSLIAQWAGVNPYPLQFGVFGGSGYDIACATHNRAILYQKILPEPRVKRVSFFPPFRDQLYFVHLNRKQNSRDAIRYFYEQSAHHARRITEINAITESILSCQDLASFQALLKQHELIIGASLGIEPVQQRLFPDFEGVVKSLGAWGGDFVLVASAMEVKKVEQYFQDRTYSTILMYEEMVK